MGPSTVVIKRGEHGVLMTTSQRRRVLRGAGAAAGGGLRPDRAPATPSPAASWATWPACGDTCDASLARAIIYGSTLASFAVEDFSIDRLLRLTQDEIAERFRQFKRLTHFDEA